MIDAGPVGRPCDECIDNDATVKIDDSYYCDDCYDREDDDYDDSMDGDFDSGMASAGFGMDEDYGDPACDMY